MLSKSFGDGIMSAIDFTDVDNEDPKGIVLKLRCAGSLPYKKVESSFLLNQLSSAYVLGFYCRNC